MSDHSPATESSSEQLFSNDEVKQFGLDDVEAGKAIGKMLSALFLYTVIAMTISALVTYYWITNPSLS